MKIGSDTVRYIVTGVISDVPENSHFDANIITSFMTNPRSSLLPRHRGELRRWGSKKSEDRQGVCWSLNILTESFILSFISLLFALIIIKVSLPYFSNLLGTRLELSLLSYWYIIRVMLLFTVVVALIAKSYPAMFLSSFNPYEVLKGSISGSMKNGRMRRVLVVFQFAVSILLIVGTVVMYRQISFMLNKDVGFNKDQLIVIERAHVLGPRWKAFKDAAREIPGVVKIASSTAVPDRNNNNNGYLIEGRNDESFLMATNWVDPDYLDTYGMKLASGRFFSDSHSTDREACLVNESAVREFGLDQPDQTRIIRPGDEGRLLNMSIIGVVNNFNHESLRNPIQHYVFCFKGDDKMWGYLTVKLAAQNYSETIGNIEKLWKEFTANNPL